MKHKQRKSQGGILAFYPFLKKIWKYAPVSKLYRGVPLFRNSILSKLSYARSNLKKKKKCMELEFREIEFQNATIGL